jgi:hypothetical protein
LEEEHASPKKWSALSRKLLEQNSLQSESMNNSAQLPLCQIDVNSSNTFTSVESQKLSMYSLSKKERTKLMKNRKYGENENFTLILLYCILYLLSSPLLRMI